MMLLNRRIYCQNRLFSLFFVLFSSLSTAQTVRCFTPNQHLVPGVSVQKEGVDGETQTLRPKKTDMPQAGLNAYDMYRMFAHIIGEKPFTDRYQWMASDLNKSGSTTTFDVVELRKLLLGQYATPENKWPNEVWRFIPQSHVFTDSILQQFDDVPDFETGVFTPKSAPILFWGIKMGDLDYSAFVPQATQNPRTNIAWPQYPTVREGHALIPVTYQGVAPVVTLQLGLRYDTNALQLITSLPNEDLPTDEKSFFMPKKGEIRHIWMPLSSEMGQTVLNAGNCLFYLMFKIKTDLPASGLPMYLDDAVLSNAGWTMDGLEHGLEWMPAAEDSVGAKAQPILQASIEPYVSQGEAFITITSPSATQARLFLFNARGIRIDMQALELQAGTQTLRMQEQEVMPAGVYQWKVVTRKEVVSGYFIRS